MDEFIEYERFSGLELADDLITLLEKNNLPFQIDDRGIRFEMLSYESPLDKQYIIKVRKDDVDKINALYIPLAGDENQVVSQDHYLHTFSDEDIIDIVANPGQWTKEEQSIANKIIRERGITITAEKIKSVRVNTAIPPQQMDTKANAKGSAGWFMTIAVLSIINTFVVAYGYNLRFMFGLGVTQLIDLYILRAADGFSIFGGMLSLIFSGLFIVLWYYAKRKNSWAYITGMILYALDMLVFLFINDLLSLGFHVFALFFIYAGFISIQKNENKAETTN